MSTWIDGPAGGLTCRQVLRALQSYLDGELDEVTAGRVTQHLAGCRRCGPEAETYQAIKNALAQRRNVSPGAVARVRDFAQSLLDEPDESAPKQRSLDG